MRARPSALDRMLYGTGLPFHRRLFTSRSGAVSAERLVISNRPRQVEVHTAVYAPERAESGDQQRSLLASGTGKPPEC